jgi:hypothetical protein
MTPISIIVAKRFLIWAGGFGLQKKAIPLEMTEDVRLLLFAFAGKRLWLVTPSIPTRSTGCFVSQWAMVND